MVRSMVGPPASFRVNLPNPISPEEVARRASSHYDDAHAQALGYKKATVGGFISGYLMLAIAEAWGRAWFEQGEFYVRQRQPIYADDDVQVSFSPMREEDGIVKSDYQVVTSEGVAGVVGWAGLRTVSSPPLLSDFPSTPALTTPVRVMEAEKRIGVRLASVIVNAPQETTEVMDVAEYRPGTSPAAGPRAIPSSLKALHPSLRERGLLVPWSMGGSSRRPDLDYEGSNIQATTEAQEFFFNIPKVSDVLTQHTRITDVYKRKGSKYLKLESLVVANGRVPILWSRTTRIVNLVREAK